MKVYNYNGYEYYYDRTLNRWVIFTPATNYIYTTKKELIKEEIDFDIKHN